MAKEKKERSIIAVAGAAALAVIGINLLISAIRDKAKRQKRGIPGSRVRINLSAADIHKLADQIIAESRDVYDSVASVPLDEVTYSNVIAPLAEVEAYQFPLIQSCLFPKMVTASDDIQKASSCAEKKLDSHFLMCRQREDVYHVIKAFVERGEKLDPQVTRYVQFMVKDFERSGVNLASSKRKELENLQSKITELNMLYIQNLNEDKSFILFSEQGLAGMPYDFIKGLERDESGLLKVHLNTYDVSLLLEYCKSGASRKLIAEAYGMICANKNLDILEKLVSLRHKYAQLLGYPSYAHLVIEPRMANTPSKVFEFLEEVLTSLASLGTREINMLKDLKRKEEGDFPFGMEDLLYYMRRAKAEHFELDLGEIRQYFPLELVLSGVCKFFQDLLGLRFEEIKGFEAWHETVRLFSVVDSFSSKLLGYFYLDIFGREGKYSHTCVVALQDGSLSSGSRQIPIVVLLSQFTKPVDGDPVLLRFFEVVRLVHEFCHLVHHICNRAAFSRFSGLRSESDFAEISGQLLEHWCYESISLKMMSGFYKDVTKSITSEICISLKKRRDIFSGLKVRLQILYCMIDQIMHSSDNVDILELFKHLHPKVMMGIPLLDGTNPASRCPVFVPSYDAICYNRIWSEVFASDVFTLKFQDNLLNQHAGLQFRNQVLSPGGAEDPLEILSRYLGREPSTQSFIDQKVRACNWYHWQTAS